jgi:hypothetical protein
LADRVDRLEFPGRVGEGEASPFLESFVGEGYEIGTGIPDISEVLRLRVGERADLRGELDEFGHTATTGRGSGHRPRTLGANSWTATRTGQVTAGGRAELMLHGSAVK